MQLTRRPADESRGLVFYVKIEDITPCLVYVLSTARGVPNRESPRHNSLPIHMNRKNEYDLSEFEAQLNHDSWMNPIHMNHDSLIRKFES